MRHPVIAYAFDTPLIVIVRLYNSGTAVSRLQKGSEDQQIFSYMSSVPMMTRGYSRSTSPRARSSARVYAAPVGLHGLLSNTSRVFGVMAAANCRGVIL